MSPAMPSPKDIFKRKPTKPAGKTPYDQVKASRAKGRPTGIDFIGAVFDGFFEFHGDRRFSDDPAIVGGIALLKGKPVTVIAHQKGTSTTDKVKRNFGSAHPEGYRKALRLMKQAQKFNRPVICFVDTAGAYCDVGAEERGQAQAIAENLVEMMGLTVPVISVFIGEGGSGGALGLAVADEVWMLEHAIYSVISPEGCAAILWKDASKVGQAAASLRLTSTDLLGFGIVERVVPETSFAQVTAELKRDLLEKIGILQAMPTAELLQRRFAKYRSIGL